MNHQSARHKDICDPVSQELLRVAHRHLQAHMAQIDAARAAGDKTSEEAAIRAAHALGEYLNEAMALVRTQHALECIADAARSG